MGPIESTLGWYPPLRFDNVRAPGGIFLVSAVILYHTISAASNSEGYHRSSLRAISPLASGPEKAISVAPKPKAATLYQWLGDGRRISHIEINIDKQKAFFYDGFNKIG